MIEIDWITHSDCRWISVRHSNSNLIDQEEKIMARKSWLDDDAQTTLIDDYARNLGSFVDAMADGIVDAR